MKRVFFLAGMFTLFLSAQALAHFQMVYTPQSALERGGAMTMKLVFTHPFDAGHTMDMAPVREFYVVQQRGEEAEPEKVDLMEYLQPISWASLTNSGKAYEAVLPSKVVRSMGDYVFVMVPGPYYEEKEDIYIQQLTKMMVNVGGVPGNWHQSLGLPAEIVALDKPYANWVGGVFRGVVMSEGKPVPHAELEVEYLNHAPNMEKNAFEKKSAIEAPHPSLEVMGIRTNAQGEFTIGLPKAGWWGVAALGVGTEDEHKGKELSQDAVLWIQVTDMP